MNTIEMVHWLLIGHALEKNEAGDPQ